MNENQAKQANVTGWPAVVFVVIILLGLIDVIERLVAAVA